MGSSNWEEAPADPEGSLKGLYVPSGLGTPQDTPGGAGEGWMGFPAGPVGSETKQMIMDGQTEAPSFTKRLFSVALRDKSRVDSRLL